jgi:hypothetical protein
VILGRPSQKSFEDIIKKGKIINNSVTVQDYRNALKIYGMDLRVLKGKTTRNKNKHVKVQFFETPKPRNIVLSVDLMNFTGLIITATLLVDRKKNTILSAIQQEMKIYQGKGHTIDNTELEEEQENPIHTLLEDNKFQALKENLEELNIQVHVVTRNEHEPEIERQNRVIKERARATLQTLPYKKIPKKMRIALIHYVVFWLNNIPKERQDESPWEMIMGEQKLDYEMICKILFGGYAQVHDDREVMNTMKQHTTGGINMGPSNMQGGHKFLSLETGEILVKRRWTELPVPNDVISRLDELSTNPEDDLERLMNRRILMRY